MGGDSHRNVAMSMRWVVAVLLVSVVVGTSAGGSHKYFMDGISPVRGLSGSAATTHATLMGDDVLYVLNDGGVTANFLHLDLVSSDFTLPSDLESTGMLGQGNSHSSFDTSDLTGSVNSIRGGGAVAMVGENRNHGSGRQGYVAVLKDSGNCILSFVNPVEVIPNEEATDVSALIGGAGVEFATVMWVAPEIVVGVTAGGAVTFSTQDVRDTTDENYDDSGPYPATSRAPADPETTNIGTAADNWHARYSSDDGDVMMAFITRANVLTCVTPSGFSGLSLATSPSRSEWSMTSKYVALEPTINGSDSTVLEFKITSKTGDGSGFFGMADVSVDVGEDVSKVVGIRGSHHEEEAFTIVYETTSDTVIRVVEFSGEDGTLVGEATDSYILHDTKDSVLDNLDYSGFSLATSGDLLGSQNGTSLLFFPDTKCSIGVGSSIAGLSIQSETLGSSYLFGPTLEGCMVGGLNNDSSVDLEITAYPVSSTDEVVVELEDAEVSEGTITFSWSEDSLDARAESTSRYRQEGLAEVSLSVVSTTNKVSFKANMKKASFVPNLNFVSTAVTREEGATFQTSDSDSLHYALSDDPDTSDVWFYTGGVPIAASSKFTPDDPSWYPSFTYFATMVALPVYTAPIQFSYTNTGGIPSFFGLPVRARFSSPLDPRTVLHQSEAANLGVQVFTNPGSVSQIRFIEAGESETSIVRESDSSSVFESFTIQFYTIRDGKTVTANLNSGSVDLSQGTAIDSWSVNPSTVALADPSSQLEIDSLLLSGAYDTVGTLIITYPDASQPTITINARIKTCSDIIANSIEAASGGCTCNSTNVMRSSGGGVSECDFCDDNTFRYEADSDSDAVCKSCGQHRSSVSGANLDAASCGCLVDYYPDPDASEGTDACLACPDEGAFCAGLDAVPVALPGFIKAVDGDGNDAFIECAGGEEACPGSGVGCGVGYEGTYCGSCSSGFYLSGNFCHECTGDTTPFVVLAVLAAMAAVGALLKLSYNPSIDTNWSSVRITINYMQFVNLFAGFELNWPDSVAETFRYMGVVNLDIDLVRPECTVGTGISYFTRWGLRVGSGAALFAILALMLGCLRFHHRMVTRFMGQRARDLCHSLPVVRSFPSLWNEPDPARRQLQYNAALRTVFTLIVGVELPLATAILGYFDCVTINGTQVLDEAREVECFTGTHFAIMPVAVIATLLVVVLVPLVLFKILYGTDPEKRSSDSFYARFGFLYARYTNVAYFWELFLLLRRLMISIFYVFFTTHASVQSVMAISVLQFSLLQHLVVMPFEQRYLNNLESLSLVSSEIVLLLGFSFLVGTSDALRSILVALALGALITTGVVMLLGIAKDVTVFLRLRNQRSVRIKGRSNSHNKNSNNSSNNNNTGNSIGDDFSEEEMEEMNGGRM